MDWNRGGEGRDERLDTIDTRAILAAVDDIDALRDHLADGDHHAPPGIRIDLLRLHRLALAATSGARDNSELFELAVELADTLDDMAAIIERLRHAVSGIATLAPDD